MCEETFAISSSNNRWGGRTERKKDNKGEKEITLFKRNSRLQISSDARGLDHIFYFPFTCGGHYKTQNTLASYQPGGDL